MLKVGQGCVMLLGLLLAGCAGMQLHSQLAEAQRDYNDDLRVCDQLNPGEKGSRPISPRLRCYGQAILHLYELSDPADADLVSVFVGKVAVAGEQYDKNQISQAQYHLVKDEAASDLKSAIIQRKNDAALVSAALAPRTCTAIGNTFTCY